MAYEAILAARYSVSKNMDTVRKAVALSHERTKNDGPFKAKCIDITGIVPIIGLTIDKIYTVYESTPDKNMLIVYGDDHDRVESYYRERFEILSEDSKSDPLAVAQLQIKKLERELLDLSRAVVKYGDRVRMSRAEPSELQQAIDAAFERVDGIKS